MKIINLILYTLLFIPSLSLAEENLCTVVVKEYLEGPNCSKTIQEYQKAPRDTWNDCYDSALKVAESYESQGPESFVGSSKFGCTTFVGNPIKHRYIEWTYEDSAIPYGDSEGKVNSNTSKYLSTPQKGDHLYFNDGSILEF